MRLYIGRLAVIAGTTALEDRTRPTPFRAELKPIGFELRDFSTTAKTGDAYALYATSPEGERLTWNGTLHTAPFASRGAFEIAALKAHTVWTYLRDSVPFELDSGVINIKGDYEVASPAGAPLQVSVGVGSIAVTQLGVKPRGGPQHYIDVARIEVDGTRIDVAKHAVNVAKVELSGGDIRAWLEQGKLNLMQLVPGAGAAAAPGAAAGAAPPPPAAASPRAWSVQVPDISVTGFKVSAEDRQVNPAAAVVLQPLNLHVAGFNLSPEDTLDVALDAGVNGSGKLRATAKVTPKSGALSAHVESSDLGLAMLQPYIGQYTSMTLLKGALGVKLDVERRADGALTVRGDTRVVDLRTVDNALHQDFIKWKDLHVAGIRYASAPASLKIGTVTAVEPYVRMIIAPDRSVNITRVLTPPGAAPKPAVDAPETSAPPAAAAPRQRDAGKAPPPAPPSKPLTPFPMTIGTVRLVNGSANYTDLWIKPSFAIGIQALGGTVTGLSSDPRSRAKVQLDGKIDRYSPWHLGGEVNVLSAALFTDLTMSFKDVDLTVVNPYSGHFAGYKIDKGKLSVDVTYKIDQRKLDAKQHFVVDQLELGERVESPDAVHLPLKIAVALLKDRHGVIDLDLPMNGSLDDPKFRIGPIIWKVFVNLITKAATAPFALLGHLFGGERAHERRRVRPRQRGARQAGAGSADCAGEGPERASAAQARRADRIFQDYRPAAAGSRTAAAGAADAGGEQPRRPQASRYRRRDRARRPGSATTSCCTSSSRRISARTRSCRRAWWRWSRPSARTPPTRRRSMTSTPRSSTTSTCPTRIWRRSASSVRRRSRMHCSPAVRSRPSRIFIVNAAPKAEGGDKVKVELAVK